MTVDELIASLEPHKGKQVRVYEQGRHPALVAPALRECLFLPEGGDVDGLEKMQHKDPWILIQTPWRQQ